MGELRESMTLEGKCDAWVGDVSDLERVVAAAESIAQMAKDRALGIFDGKSESRIRAEVESYQGAVDGNSERVAKEVEKEIQRDLEIDRSEIVWEYRVRMTARHRRFSREVEGDPVEVVAKLEPRQVHSVEITLRPGWSTGGETYNLILRLDRGGGVPGYTWRLEGSDRDWLVLANDKLQNLARESTPWYHFLLRKTYAFPIHFLLSLALAWSILQGVGGLGLGTALDLPVRALVLGVLSILIAGAGVKFTFKYLPSFELVDRGAKSRGARVLGVLGTVAITILGGLAVSLLSGW